MHGFDFGAVIENRSLLLHGMVISLELTAAAVAGGVLFGTVLAVMRLSRSRILGLIAAGYVNLFRSMPLILVIFWFYILVPKAIGAPIGPFYSVLIAFTLFEAAYYCEIIRAGISSVRRAQLQAGLALGLTYPQVLRYVILPQAFRNMVPVLLTQSIIMFQDTSLVYVVGLRDFLTAADIVANTTNRPIELYLTVILVYLAICFSASRLVDRLRRRYAL